MIRHQIARILSAIADRLEVEKPAPVIQYIYVTNPPPTTVTFPATNICSSAGNYPTYRGGI